MLIVDNKRGYDMAQDVVLVVAGMPKTVKELIDAGLERTGLSQSDLARKTGINRASVSRFCSGETSPKPENAIQIARLLEIPVIEMLEAAGHHKVAQEYKAAAQAASINVLA